MTFDNNGSGLLDGKDAIKTYLNNASDYMLKKWVNAGLPVLIEDGRWLAHKDNIENFFKIYTRQKTQLPDDFENHVK